MKILFLSIGKANEPYVADGIALYTKRISHYFPVEWTIIPPPKGTGFTALEQKEREAASIRQLLKEGDYLVALDEGGKALTSVALSEFIEQRAGSSIKRIIFLIGGAYGLDQNLLNSAAFKWSLSTLTFPHQLVRLILSEQIYRACTILRNEKYHHR